MGINGAWGFRVTHIRWGENIGKFGIQYSVMPLLPTLDIHEITYKVL